MEKVMVMGAQTSFLFFLVSHIKIAKVEKVESLTKRTEKEHDEGRSEPSKRKEKVTR